MIRIESIEPVPIAELRYLHARSGGGSEVSRLSVLRATVGPLAHELDAIVCCSDLQGMVAGDRLGVAVAELLVQLAEDRVLDRAIGKKTGWRARTPASIGTCRRARSQR